MAKIIFLLLISYLSAEIQQISPPICLENLEQLALTGLNYAYGSPFRPVEEEDPEQSFILDFAKKSEAFQKHLGFPIIKPHQTVTVEKLGP